MWLRNLALVVPDDSGLKNAAAEKQFMKGLNGVGRKIEEIAATFVGVTQAMETGNYDAWHFTGHARAYEGTDADKCFIELTNRQQLRPADIIGTVENVRRSRPFIFFNGCQSAQAGRSLTGVGGWARRFLKPGPSSDAASAFIGTYWSVDDGVAFEFAKALYGKLLAGVPVGEAAKDARLAIQQGNNSTWLAYTVYADPMATVVN
jgi:CHAT domain-containing protein